MCSVDGNVQMECPSDLNCLTAITSVTLYMCSVLEDLFMALSDHQFGHCPVATRVAVPGLHTEYCSPMGICLRCRPPEEEPRHQAQSARERRHFAASIPATTANFQWPVCARLCKSRIGLQSHSRIHRGTDKSSSRPRDHHDGDDDEASSPLTGLFFAEDLRSAISHYNRSLMTGKSPKMNMIHTKKSFGVQLNKHGNKKKPQVNISVS